jgi:hypothetical protein
MLAIGPNGMFILQIFGLLHGQQNTDAIKDLLLTIVSFVLSTLHMSGLGQGVLRSHIHIDQRYGKISSF